MSLEEQFTGDASSIKHEIEQSYDSDDTVESGKRADTLPDSPLCINGE